MKIINSLLLIMFFFVSNNVGAGGMTSSGADYLTTENNPWFIGQAPIFYCIKADNFSRNQISSEAIVNEAIQDWVTNLKRLRLQMTSFALPDGEKKSLSLEFIKVPCTEKVNLQFLLGSINSDVKNELAHLATYVVAFSFKGKTDDLTGRANGYVWLSPDMGPNALKGIAAKNFWLKDHVLYNVVLHELGHVFGIEHQFAGFMASQAPYLAVVGLLREKATVASLTAQNWLQTEQKNCGFVWGHDESKISVLFKIKNTEGLRICVEPRSSLNSIIHFDLNVKNGHQDVLNFSFEGEPVVNIMNNVTVVGKYFEAKVGTPFDYKWHVFFNLANYKFSGKIEINGKKYPIIIEQKMGAYLDYSVIDGENIISFKSDLGLPSALDLK